MLDAKNARRLAGAFTFAAIMVSCDPKHITGGPGNTPSATDDMHKRSVFDGHSGCLDEPIILRSACDLLANAHQELRRFYGIQ